MTNSVTNSKAYKRLKEIAEKKYNIFVQSTWSLEELRNKVNAASAKQSEEDRKSGKTTTEPVKAEYTLPAKQSMDVHAPQMVVHVPAPAVTINHGDFNWHACWQWLQAFVIGMSAAHFLPSLLELARGY